MPHLAYSGWAACPFTDEGWNASGESGEIRQSASRSTIFPSCRVMLSPVFLGISPGKERGLGNVRQRLSLSNRFCRAGDDSCGNYAKHDQCPLVYSHSRHYFGFLARKQEEQEVRLGCLASCSLIILVGIPIRLGDGSCAPDGRSRRIAAPSADRSAGRLP